MTLNSLNKNSMLCPHCRRLISRDEEKCPYCGTKNPASWWKNNSFVGILNDPYRLVKLIIGLNIGMYIISILLNPRSSGYGFNPFSFLSPSDRSLLLLGSTGTYPVYQMHRWWSLISANYLHGSLLHILFNMLAFWQLGPIAIREYGGYRMVIIYTLGGILGFLVSVLAGVHFTIGASAAVCSLIGAMLYFGKSYGGRYGNAVYSQLLGWSISIFAFGFLVPGINNWGHGGGMAAGALLGYLLGYQARGRESSIYKYLAVGCMVITVLVLAWAVLTSVLYLLLT